MSTNIFGVDAQYFKTKLGLVIRDLDNYTPTELARELLRLGRTADSDVLMEPEFQVTNLIDERRY